MLKVTKGNALIEPVTQATSLGNGLQINNETQNRKDIVTGRVIDGSEELIGAMVYFPLYATSQLTFDGVDYLVLNEQDILAYDDTENN